jgi:hypothetical protein
MEKEQCNNNECGEYFIIDIQLDFGVGNKEKEEIICPHCGELNGTIMTSGHINPIKCKNPDK